MDEGLADANHYTVSGDGLEITVSPGPAGEVQLGYRGAAPARTFTADEVVDEQGIVGSSVSVTLQEAPDRGRTTLTVLVPRVRVRPGERVRIQTIGITTVHLASIAPAADHGQLERSTITELQGVATFVRI
ncbi:hypothetical protein EV383_5674 [Pseudonocardia sediminis]|uniref:Uncharacterized protein n=1 Tax=Pseudonocardia sediminis TaxID=1397368 RepID=A0A4Q7V7J5_PSEST|nr:hypothetical protein [Pseudonocardia sediminis]RZT88729.1 hypothetical protein EV383_5674 [Pseudonocardia sediminis]